MNQDEFKILFDDEYLNSISPNQFEWRLKNMARDLKKYHSFFKSRMV